MIEILFTFFWFSLMLYIFAHFLNEMFFRHIKLPQRTPQEKVIKLEFNDTLIAPIESLEGVIAQIVSVQQYVTENVVFWVLQLYDGNASLAASTESAQLATQATKYKKGEWVQIAKDEKNQVVLAQYKTFKK